MPPFKDLAGRQRGQISASLRGISLEGLQSMFNSPALDQVQLRRHNRWGYQGKLGRRPAKSRRRGGRNRTLFGRPAREARLRRRSLSRSTASIHARYSAKAQQLSLAQSSLRTPQTTLTMDGVIGGRSNLQVQLQAHALQEVETLAEHFSRRSSRRATSAAGSSWDGFVSRQPSRHASES